MMTVDMNGLLTAPAAPRSPRQRTPVGDRRSPASPGRPPSHPGRRIVMGVLVGALTMFGVATLDTFAGASVPVLGTLAALPSAVGRAELADRPAPPADPGTCLTWSRPDAADTAVVDCGKTHLFEQAGAVTLTDQVALPDDRQWRQLVSERCAPMVVGYLNGKFDPDGRYRVGALKPSPEKWADGDRQLRCGLQSSSRSGVMFPTAGRVVDADQSPVQEPGTCLGIDGRTVGDPVDCAGAHAVETVGVVDLATKFADRFPDVGDQDSFLQPECGKIAEKYAGGADTIKDKKLTVYWDNVTEESWAAGTRKVNCNLAALLPDRSGFAPVTGAVAGDVVVGDTPAPPSTGVVTPGAPAPPTSSDPAAPSSPAAEDPDEPPTDGPADDADQSPATPKPPSGKPAVPTLPDLPSTAPLVEKVLPSLPVGNA